MEAALPKCHEKGIGIFAVKTMGLCVQKETGLPVPQIPVEIRSRIRMSDYSFAKVIWPQKMPITQLMQEVCMELRR